ncbi:MAG: transglycosylase SLT domain-containing protein [Thiotrichaceae bacterium]
MFYSFIIIMQIYVYGGITPLRQKRFIVMWTKLLGSSISPTIHTGQGKSSKAAYAQTLDTVRIYKFIDNDGTVHLSDRQLDARYQLIYNGNGTLQPLAGGRYPMLEVMRRKFSDYADLVKSAATETQVEAALLHAVIQVESAYNPRAVSPKGVRLD